MNPKLLHLFHEKECEFKKDSITANVYAFHGTTQDCIDPIVKQNFDITKVGKRMSNFGYFGRGIYFSEKAHYASSYSTTNSLILCKLLMGKTYKCPQIRLGIPCEQGYNSHRGQGGDEIVIFDNTQILPCYIVYY